MNLYSTASSDKIIYIDNSISDNASYGLAPISSKLINLNLGTGCWINC